MADALERQNITVLSDSRVTVQFQNHAVDIVGVPDAHVTRTDAFALLAGILPDSPIIVLAHDPVWFAYVPPGPNITLAEHTHGGQIRFPGIGIITNASKAPLRWGHGLIHEKGKYLYVTSGIGTSGLPLRWGVPPRSTPCWTSRVPDFRFLQSRRGKELIYPPDRYQIAALRQATLRADSVEKLAG